MNIEYKTKGDIYLFILKINSSITLRKLVLGE